MFKDYQSIILQTVCLCLYYDAHITFGLLEQYQWTFLMFSRLYQHIDRMSRDFEMRRIIFGLTVILQVSDACQLPPMVSA
jgi:hypothetical protein